MKGNKYQMCTRCIYDTKVPRITFNQKGVCSYCELSDNLIEMYDTGRDAGQNELNTIIGKIKKDGKNKKYDCVIGVSGGTDSSFMMHIAVKEWGLRPLAVHYDNTWNSSIATENIKKVANKLKIDLFTIVVENKESDDIFRSFFKAGVPEIDAPTDLGFAETHYRAASKHGIKYVLEGHSFMEEGVSPLSTMYFDGKYIKSIHKKFGSIKMRTYPLMDFMAFMKWSLFKRIKKIRPFWYMKYSKQKAMELLKKEYDWKYYGGHHLENRMSAFMHSYYLPKRFNIDQRNNMLSALVRNGALDRKKALEIYGKAPHIETGLVEYFKKRLNLSDDDFIKIMDQPTKTFLDYPTSKRRFEKLRPLFFVLAKSNLVPMSFYLKYCFPIKKE
jgi:N-acetyl sugar amidotransferase